MGEQPRSCAPAADRQRGCRRLASGRSTWGGRGARRGTGPVSSPGPRSRPRPADAGCRHTPGRLQGQDAARPRAASGPATGGAQACPWPAPAGWLCRRLLPPPGRHPAPRLPGPPAPTQAARWRRSAARSCARTACAAGAPVAAATSRSGCPWPQARRPARPRWRAGSPRRRAGRTRPATCRHHRRSGPDVQRSSGGGYHDHPAISGRQVRAGARQSMPSRSMDNCAGVSVTAPSRTLGHTNRPRSSRLA